MGDLRERLEGLLQGWKEAGRPSRWALEHAFQSIIEWREGHDIPGLFDPPPLMVTATLDDGWGHGLRVIHACAQAAGVRIHSLGLMQSADAILDACREFKPELLGLTMLQLDSEPALAALREHLPHQTQLIVGGPPFQIDPDLSERCGVHFVARSAADFLQFLLGFRPDEVDPA